MEKIIGFLPTDNLLLMGVIVLLVILFIISLVKSLFKLAMFVALIAIVAIVFFGVAPDELFKKGEEIANTSVSYLKQTVKPVITKELDKAHYQKNKDGSMQLYTEKFSLMKSKNGTITGMVNDLKITLSKEDIEKMFSPDEIKKIKAKFATKEKQQKA